jgi:hypothetical protein
MLEQWEEHQPPIRSNTSSVLRIGAPMSTAESIAGRDDSGAQFKSSRPGYFRPEQCAHRSHRPWSVKKALFCEPTTNML